MKILIIFLMLISMNIQAASLYATSTIKTLFTGPAHNNLVLIGLQNRPSQVRPESCGENSNFDFALDLTTPHGQEYYSAIIAAYMAKTTLRVRSYDRCTLHPTVPDLKDIWLK